MFLIIFNKNLLKTIPIIPKKEPCSLNAPYVINKWFYKVNTFIQFLSIRYADQVFVCNEVLIERNDEVVPAKVIDVSNLHLQGNKSTNYLFYYLYLSVT